MVIDKRAFPSGSVDSDCRLDMASTLVNEVRGALVDEREPEYFPAAGSSPLHAKLFPSRFQSPTTAAGAVNSRLRFRHAPL